MHSLHWHLKVRHFHCILLYCIVFHCIGNLKGRARNKNGGVSKEEFGKLAFKWVSMRKTKEGQNYLPFRDEAVDGGEIKLFNCILSRHLQIATELGRQWWVGQGCFCIFSSTFQGKELRNSIMLDYNYLLKTFVFVLESVTSVISSESKEPISLD